MPMPVFTESVCGGRITVHVGETFAFEIKENPTTGYRWEFVADAGLTVLSSSYTVSPGGAVGGGGVRRLLVRCDTPGGVVLRGQLLRSWLGPSSAIARCEITVEVSPIGDQEPTI